MACIIGYWWEGVIMGWSDCGGREGDCGIEEGERVNVGWGDCGGRRERG